MRRARRSVLFAMRAWVIAVAVTLLPCSARAQPEEPWAPAVREGLAAAERGDWERVAEQLGAAARQLEDLEREDQHAFACELAAAELRHGDDDAMARSRVADGIATARGPRGPACHAMIADAYVAAGEPELAAHHFLAALEAGASAEVRARYEALEPGLRRDAERLRRALQTRPLGEAIGAAATPEALSRAIEHGVERARPDRLASCSTMDAWRGFGRIMCTYRDGPTPVAFGAASYPLETFVYATSGGRARVVASYPSGTGYDCEAGHTVEDTGRTRLTAREHGVDGWLFRVRERVEPVLIGDEYGARERRLVYACDTRRGVCARVEEAAQSCVDTARQLNECRGYEGQASVRRGQLTIRVDRGELPDGLRDPVDLSGLSRPLPAARDPRRAETRSMRGCQVVVRDSQPPLNVRARPSARAAVVGSLEDGVAVTIATRAGAWARLSAPIAGYVWRRNLARVCAPGP